MKFEELYKELGGDYPEAVERFGGENTLKRFVLKFMNDDNFKLLSESLEKGDCKTAFRFAHTLKGICLNMDFGNMTSLARDITEKLRAGDLNGAAEVFPSLKREYDRTIELLKMTER